MILTSARYTSHDHNRSSVTKTQATDKYINRIDQDTAGGTTMSARSADTLRSVLKSVIMSSAEILVSSGFSKRKRY